MAITFAVASGVSPDKGLITAIVAGFIILEIGGNRVQIGVPTVVFIVVVFGIVYGYGLDGLMISSILPAFLDRVWFDVFRLIFKIYYLPVYCWFYQWKCPDYIFDSNKGSLRLTTRISCI